MYLTAKWAARPTHLGCGATMYLDEQRGQLPRQERAVLWKEGGQVGLSRAAYHSNVHVSKN